MPRAPSSTITDQRLAVAGVDQPHAAAIFRRIVRYDELVVQRLSQADSRLDRDLVLTDRPLSVAEVDDAQGRRTRQNRLRGVPVRIASG